MFFILSLLPVLTFTERHAFIFLIRIFNESMIADPDKIHDSSMAVPCGVEGSFFKMDCSFFQSNLYRFYHCPLINFVLKVFDALVISTTYMPLAKPSVSKTMVPCHASKIFS